MSCNFFTCANDYCEKTRNVDEMLSRFREDKRQTVEMLSETPELLSRQIWGTESILSRDTHCLVRMGLGDNTNGLINYYVCPQCKNMRRLTDLPALKPFMLECGNRAGDTLEITGVPVYKACMKLVKPLKGESKLSVSPPQETRWQCDFFTSGVLTQWSLSDLPHVQPLQIAWICGENGYLLLDHPNIGTLDQFQKFPSYLDTSEQGQENSSPTASANDKSAFSLETVTGILQQLIWTCLQLEKNKVSHVNPSTQSLVFTKSPVSYMAGTIHVTSPVTLEIGNWLGSGISVNQNRIYPSCPIAELELTARDPFSPIDLFETDRQTIVYRLKKSPKTRYLFNYLQGLGFPIYCSSFNLYSFLTVLLCEKAFYVTFMKHFQPLWDSLWLLEKDSELYKSKIQNYHDADGISAEQVFELLTGLHLKSDANLLAWNSINA